MLVRFFCLIGGRGEPWPDIAHGYLSALVRSGVPVRALTISRQPFLASAYMGPDHRHWNDISPVFATPLEGTYLNIVCCGPGTPLGGTVSGADLAPAKVRSVERSQDGDEVFHRPPGVSVSVSSQTGAVYEPEPALVGLWTDKRRNIAITGPYPRPTVAEIDALKRYDAVLCPDEEAGKELEQLTGLRVGFYPPEQLESEATHLPFLLDEVQ